MSNSFKIPEELAEKIRRESAEIAKKNMDRAQEFDAYSEFVESQKKDFQEDVNIMLNIITRLIMEGKLYIHTKFVARIKDPESALQNDTNYVNRNNLMEVILSKIDKTDYELLVTDSPITKAKKSKTLDDVFGITIITDTEEEIETLHEEIKKAFNIQKSKKMNKENYHATHLSLWRDEENQQSPVIECQLKTRQDYINSYDHTIYKVESKIQRKLFETNEISDNKKVKLNRKGVEKVESTIQEYYDSGKFSVLTNLPRMWEAVFKEEPEEMEIKRLTEAQTLKRVYPSLVIRSDKSR